MKWIVAAIALLCLAFAFNLGLLVFAIYALVAVVVVARMVTRRWARSIIGLKQISHTHATIGATVEVGLEVENTDQLPITWALVEDLIHFQSVGRNSPALTVAGDRVAVLKFAPGQKHRLKYQFKCNRRGYFQIGPTVAETGDMFGFNRQYRVLAEPRYLLVYPKVIPWVVTTLNPNVRLVK